MYIKSFDGTRIYYTIKRKSSLFLIFIHGWTNNWTAWKKEIGFFQRKGCSTLALDLRGHGRSDKPQEKGQYSLGCFAKDIHKIIKKERISKFILIGHSMGGMIALTYYKLFSPTAEALVLCSTVYKNLLGHKPLRILLPFIKLFLKFIIPHTKINQKYFAGLKNIDLSEYQKHSDYFIFYKSIRNTPIKSVLSCLQTMIYYDVKDIMSKIEIPVLIIKGKKDRVVPKAYSMEACKEMKHSEITLIPKATHCLNVQNPGIVEKYISDFLEKHRLK